MLADNLVLPTTGKQIREFELLCGLYMRAMVEEAGD